MNTNKSRCFIKNIIAKWAYTMHELITHVFTLFYQYKCEASLQNPQNVSQNEMVVNLE